MWRNRGLVLITVPVIDPAYALAFGSVLLLLMVIPVSLSLSPILCLSLSRERES